MTTAYRLAAPAEADLEDIYRYTADAWGYDQAHRYLAELQQRFVEVADNPLLGRDRGDLRRGIRSRTAGHHVIYYAILDGIVVILRVMHPRQRMDRSRLTGRGK